MLWGTVDQANNAPKLVVDGGSPNTTAQTMFGNLTANSFVSGVIIGSFGVDATEMSVDNNGKVLRIGIANGGVGYLNATAVAFTGGDPSTNAAATLTTNSTGGVVSFTISNNGVGYGSVPTAVATSRINATVTIVAGGTGYANDAALVFSGGGGTGAAGNVSTNSTGGITSVTVSNKGNGYSTTPGITVAGGTGANLVAVLEGTGANIIPYLGEAGKVPHSGWVVRREGTGGRQGRVHFEVLVAAGSMPTSDASDDTVLPDS